MSKVEEEIILEELTEMLEISPQKKKNTPACCVCTELPYDPQSLSCGHSLCIICCETMLIKTLDFLRCPLCTKETLSTAIIPNYALREILQSDYEDEYKKKENEDKNRSKIRKASIGIKKLMKEKKINICVGKDTDPEFLLKLLTDLENNVDKSKPTVELVNMIRLYKKPFMYFSSGASFLELVYSSGFYYVIFSPSYKLIVLT